MTATAQSAPSRAAARTSSNDDPMLTRAAASLRALGGARLRAGRQPGGDRLARLYQRGHEPPPPDHAGGVAGARGMDGGAVDGAGELELADRRHEPVLGGDHDGGGHVDLAAPVARVVAAHP